MDCPTYDFSFQKFEVQISGVLFIYMELQSLWHETALLCGTVREFFSVIVARWQEQAQAFQTATLDIIHTVPSVVVLLNNLGVRTYSDRCRI
jgi:hypothetical protein